MNTNTPNYRSRIRDQAKEGDFPVPVTRRDFRTYFSAQGGAIDMLGPVKMPPNPSTEIPLFQPRDLVPQKMDMTLEFDLPRYRASLRPTKLVRRKFPWRQTLIRAFLVVFVSVAIVGGTFAWKAYASLHTVFRGTQTVAALSKEPANPQLLKGEGDGRVNILLLGVGGANHDGGDLTDTMMVMSVDPVNHQAALLSVPRDLWVKMPTGFFGQYQKINAAYSSGKYAYLGKSDLADHTPAAIDAGFSAVDQTVGQVLGIDIDYHVLVDFRAFEQAVDSVHGVSVTVQDPLIDPTMAWENGNNPVLAPRGAQTMNGKQALLYARSRETSSDFARSTRQRQLLTALKQKIVALGTLTDPTKINNLMNTFSDNVQTDLSTQAAARLFSIMKAIPDSSITSLSLAESTNLVTTDTINGSSVVRPKEGIGVYSGIQAYVRSQLVDGYLAKEKAPVYVIAANDTKKTQTTAMLATYGYTILGSNTHTDLPQTDEVIDLSRGASPFTAHYLVDRYRVTPKTTVPANLTVPSGAQFVIIVGI